MKLLRKINSLSGIITVVAMVVLIANLISARSFDGSLPAYYSAAAALIFGAVYLISTAIFVLYNIKSNLAAHMFWPMVGRYVFSFVVVWLLCLVANKVAYGSLGFLLNGACAAILALIPNYVGGYRKAGRPENSD